MTPQEKLDRTTLLIEENYHLALRGQEAEATGEDVSAVIATIKANQAEIERLHREVEEEILQMQKETAEVKLATARLQAETKAGDARIAILQVEINGINKRREELEKKSGKVYLN